jgi:hypothetical protein
VCSEDPWMEVAWKQETIKDCWSIRKEAEGAFNRVGGKLELTENSVIMNGDLVHGEWQKIYQSLKKQYEKLMDQKRKDDYILKKMQSDVWKEQTEDTQDWLKRNLDPVKTASIINMQEQMVETRSWKISRALIDPSEKCRLCGEYNETVHHLVAGCKVLAGKDYLRRHNKALMIFAVQYSKLVGLITEDTVWYKEHWDSGKVIENQEYTLRWDFETVLRKTDTHRRPDLWLEDKKGKIIWIIDMACPMERNICAKDME